MPGYVAPADTVRPASRVTTLLLRIIVEAAAAGRIPDADIRDAEAQPVADAVAPIRSYLPPGVPAPLVQRALMVWTNLFGVISFELFGQLHNVVAEPPAGRDAFFAESIRRWLELHRHHLTHPPLVPARTNAMKPGIHGVRTH